MKKLSQDWLIEGMMDFEYKQYQLLAYIKDVRKHFEKSILYPFLSDLIHHYRNLQRIKDEKELLSDNFPKALSQSDIEKLRLNYEKIVKDDEVMREMEEVILYSLPRIDQTIQEGREIYDFVEEQLELSPVGLSPLYNKEGYLFINQDARRDVSIYRYSISIFENSEEKYRGINTTYVGEDFQDFSRTYEKIKLDLVKKYIDLPNPASFLLVSRYGFPEKSTILPIAQRLLIKYVDAN